MIPTPEGHSIGVRWASGYRELCLLRHCSFTLMWCSLWNGCTPSPEVRVCPAGNQRSVRLWLLSHSSENGLRRSTQTRLNKRVTSSFVNGIPLHGIPLGIPEVIRQGNFHPLPTAPKAPRAGCNGGGGPACVWWVLSLCGRVEYVVAFSSL